MDKAETRRIQKHFLGVDLCLPELASAWLLAQREGGLRDFSDTLVLVPTREAGRLLREYLARESDRQECGVLPPVIMTPQAWLTQMLGDVSCAGAMESFWAWHEVLRAEPLERYQALFPVLPEKVSAGWTHAFASRIESLKAVLAEEGLDFGDVSERLDLAVSEHERWRCLLSLNKRYVETLALADLRDRHAVSVEQAGKLHEAHAFEQVVLMGLPDPLPVVLHALKNCAVDVVIYASQDTQAGFDLWGRPLHEYWSSVEIPIEEASIAVHAEPAELVKALAGSVPESQIDSVVLGLGDKQWREALGYNLLSEGVTVFDPEGQPASLGEWVKCLRLIHESAVSGRLESVRQLVCVPWVRVCLKESGVTASLSEMLEAADMLHQRHLVQTVSDVLDCRKRNLNTGRLWQDVVAVLSPLFEQWLSVPHAEGLLSVTQRLCGGSVLEASNPFPEEEVSVLQEWLALLGRVEVLEREGASVDAVALREWLLEELGKCALYAEREEGALELKGWLELLWEDAPGVELVGLHEGSVPEFVGADAFLPGSAREKLGLRSNDFRYAQDAYRLSVIAKSRQADGALRVHHCRVNYAQDAVKPSRLLFHCADEALASRVEQLFDESSHRGYAPAPSAPWTLSPREAEMPVRFSPTTLRAFLSDPYSFYLRYMLRMESIDALKCELDGGQYGELCHDVLKQLGEEDALRDCTDDRVLKDYLQQALSDLMRLRYGRKRTVPLQIQEHSAQERLSYAASLLAQERAQGWFVPDSSCIEWKFSEESALEIAGVRVTGQIDRIEKNEVDGRWRIVDFKTGEQSKGPQESHIHSSRVKRREYMRDYFMLPDGKRIWKDLQLPLYAVAAAKRLNATVETAYLLMPKAVSETRLASWRVDEATCESALRCAEGIIKDVRAGNFFPCADYSAGRFRRFPQMLEESLREHLDEGFFKAHGGEVSDG